MAPAMLTKMLLLPLLLHVLMVLVLGLRTLLARVQSVRSGKTKIGAIALDNKGWPPRVLQLGNNFDNQFDTPMLWYAVCGLAIATGLQDMTLAVLSWLFLVTRLVHSYVHTTSNHILARMIFFLLGFGVLVLMWLWFGIRLMIVT